MGSLSLEPDSDSFYASAGGTDPLSPCNAPPPVERPPGPVGACRPIHPDLAPDARVRCWSWAEISAVGTLELNVGCGVGQAPCADYG